MAILYNLCRVTTPTIGIGNVTLGAAVPGYITWIQAGAVNGDVVSYALHDFVGGVLVASEVGRGTYIAAFNSFSRDVVLDSTAGGARINLSGNAQAMITFLAEDYTAAEIGADVAGTAAGTIAAHLLAFNHALLHDPVTIGAPANGLSIAPGQVLSIGLASAGVTGVLSGADWTDFDSKQDALALPLSAANGGTGVSNGAGASLTLSNVALSILSSAASTLSLAITAGKTLTLTATDDFNLTVPATGTAALLGIANIFTAAQTINVDSATAFIIRTSTLVQTLLINTTTGGSQFGWASGMATGTGHAFYTGDTGEVSILTQTANGSPKWLLRGGATNRWYIASNIIATGDLVFYGYGTPAGNKLYLTSAGLVGIGPAFSAPLTRLHVMDTTTTTNAVKEILRIESRVSTAATGGAAGFGPGLGFFAEDATDTTYQQQGLISGAWVDATDATRKAKLSFSAYDTAVRLGLEIEATGSAATVTMLGHTYLPGDSRFLYFGTGNDMSIYYDGTFGNIDTDLVAPSDLTIDCGTAKTLVLEVPVYNDANVGALVLQTGGTLPGIVEILESDGGASGIYTRGFAVNEQGSGAIEIPHDYKEGTDIIFHVHWMGQDAPTGTDNVRWQITYSVTRDEVVTPAITTVTAAADTAFDTRYEWKRTDIATITGATFKIGDQFNFTLTRIAASGDAYAGEALVATIGFHYQTDTLGSRQVGTK